MIVTSKPVDRTRVSGSVAVQLDGISALVRKDPELAQRAACLLYTSLTYPTGSRPGADRFPRRGHTVDEANAALDLIADAGVAVHRARTTTVVNPATGHVVAVLSAGYHLVAD